MSEAGRRSLLARYGLPPAEIERRSRALVEAAAGPRLPSEPGARAVASSMLYALGEPELVEAIRIHPAAVAAGLAALRAGRPVVVDVRMVRAGLDSAAFERLGCEVRCALEVPGVDAAAAAGGVTRLAAAFELLAPELDGAVVAVGNAPTALLALLDAVDEGRARPALIIGTPVGLVAAAESKEELARRGVPFVTLLGRRGGSAAAAAALNALARLAAG